MSRKSVLVLRSCYPDLTSYNGFVWPESGYVEAPDWDPSPICGGGLHGWLWGEGEGSLGNWEEDAKWLVVKVAASKIVDLGGKVKFPSGEVVFCGNRKEATEYLLKKAPDKIIIGAEVTVGDQEIVSTGDKGISIAGNCGIARAKELGSARAGDCGIALTEGTGKSEAGRGGIAVAGSDGFAKAGFAGIGLAKAQGHAKAGERGFAAVIGDGGIANAENRGRAITEDWGVSTAGELGVAITGHSGQANAEEEGVAIAGYLGNAIAGYLGKAIAGDGGQAIAGNGGIAMVGARGYAKVGSHGTAIGKEFSIVQAGIGGNLCLEYIDCSNRRSLKTAQIGENGILPDVKYSLDEEGNFFEVR